MDEAGPCGLCGATDHPDAECRRGRRATAEATAGLATVEEEASRMPPRRFRDREDRRP